MKRHTKLHHNFPKGRIRSVRFSPLHAQFRTPQMMEINKLGLHVSGARREKKRELPLLYKSGHLENKRFGLCHMIHLALP